MPKYLRLEVLLLLIALTAFGDEWEQLLQKQLEERQHYHQHHQNLDRDCGPNAFSFFDKCFCEPGWEGASPPKEPIEHDFPPHLLKEYECDSIPKRGLHITCTKPILQVADCLCEPNLIDRSFLRDPNWHHPQGFRCQNLCRMNDEVGVIYGDLEKWEQDEAESGIQIQYYKQYLPRLLEPGGRENNHVVLRLDELSGGFEDFKALDGINLGHTIEFGCGPYTQVRNIMERVNVTLESLVLSDPIIDLYKKIEGTTYQNGSFTVNGKAYPVSFNNLTTEEWGKQVRRERSMRQDHNYSTFDTVVFMNALIYSQDAVQLLTTLYDALKPGGLLIFMDRWFENWVTSSTCGAFSFEVNVVQVGKPLIFQFLSRFSDRPFFSLLPTEQMKHSSEVNCGDIVDFEPGMFVAVRKER